MSSTVEIDVSDGLREYIDGRVAAGRYGSVSEYVLDLIRRDRDEQARTLPPPAEDGAEAP